MDPQFWHERWRRGETGWHLPHPNPHLQRYWSRIPVPPGGRVFVPLCGKTHDLAWLAGRGHPVVGVELSPLAVAGFFETHGLHPERAAAGPFERWRAGEIEILCGDFFELRREHLRPVAAVWDRAALIAMPPQMRPRYVRRLLRVVPADTPVLLATMEYPQQEMAGPPFSVPEDEVNMLYGERFSVERLHAEDTLAAQPRFRERGLTRLVEKVYRLLPREKTTQA
jgi:thiopurine S-methyltransferase